MKTRLFLCLLAVLFSSLVASAQQPAQPLTFWYGYHVIPGKEDEFLDLVKTVGQPVRDKLMADGVILAWGLETPLLRVPGQASHLIWYAVADWSGIEKVDAAMRAQIAKLGEEPGPSAGKKVQKGSSVTDRIRAVTELDKTHDYVTRDLVISLSPAAPSGALPWTRYNFLKAKPGKAGEYRKAWEKYNKPVFDKLLADGVLAGFGLAVEDVRTDGDFTHFVWLSTRDLASQEKVRAAFLADRERRTQEEQDAINNLFVGLVDPDASRSVVTRSVIFHVPAQK